MIHIRTTLTSDTPHLPELAPLIGRPVSITVEEEQAGDGPPSPAAVAAAERAIQELHDTGFDFGVYDRLAEIEWRAAERLGRGE